MDSKIVLKTLENINIALTENYEIFKQIIVNNIKLILNLECLRVDLQENQINCLIKQHNNIYYYEYNLELNIITSNGIKIIDYSKHIKLIIDNTLKLACYNNYTSDIKLLNLLKD